MITGTMMRILLALALALAGAWIGSRVVYVNHNPLYRHLDPAHGTVQERTADNAWKWWVGLLTGAFIGAALPFLEPKRR